MNNDFSVLSLFYEFSVTSFFTVKNENIHY